MGIETTPDVEESTEPPICCYTEPISPSNATQTSLSIDQGDTNEKSGIAINQLSPAGTDQHILPGLLEKPEHQIKNAHLLEPSEVVALLCTDLQCVKIDETFSTTHPLLIIFLDMDFPARKRTCASTEMVLMRCRKRRGSPSGGYC